MKEPTIQHLQLCNISASFDNMRKKSILTDVILICEAIEFPAHKVFLCASSSYFNTMFHSDFKEAYTGKVQFDLVTAHTMDILLTFIYTGNIPNVVNDDVDQLKLLLEASHLMEIVLLFQYCLNTLSSKVSSTYFQEVYCISELYDIPALSSKVVTFLAKNFDEIVESKDFEQLTDKQFKQLLEHPELGGFPSDDVVQGVIKWVEYDKINRQHCLAQFLPISNSDEITGGGVMTHVSHFGTKLLCFGKHDGKWVLTIYNVEENTWSSTRDLPFCLVVGTAVIYYVGCVYFIGGGDCTNVEPSTEVHQYCPFTNTHVSTHNLDMAVCHAGAGVLHGWIYILNGMGKRKMTSNSVQRFNVTSKACETVTSTQEGHYRPHVFTYLDYLYVVGSCDNRVRRIERYNPLHNQWTVVTDIPGSILWCRAVLYYDRLFVAKLEENRFHIYDFEADVWEVREFADGPNPMWGLWSVCSPGTQPALLARDQSRTLHSFDLHSFTWRKISEPNHNAWYSPQTVVMA